MKAIQGIIFVTLCLSYGSCDIPGTLVGLSRLTSRTPPSCLNLVYPICGNCTTVLRCMMEDPAPETVCKDQNPDRPYCSNGGCVAEPPAGCQASTAFSCTGAGYYPDALNCSRYHLCGGPNAAGAAYSLYECPPGFVYNPATTMCKLSKTAADCAVVDCSTDPMGYIAYPADNSFFVYCSPDEEPKVVKCPVNNVFVPESFSCMFKCPREGRIADPTDIRKFYECYFDGTTYFSQSLSCVSTYEFSPDLEQCIQTPMATPPTG